MIICFTSAFFLLILCKNKNFEILLQIDLFSIIGFSKRTDFFLNEWKPFKADSPLPPHRCEIEERNTRRLERQVALLRESKRKADQSAMMLQADCQRSMMELQEMDREFEVLPVCSLHQFV